MKRYQISRFKKLLATISLTLIVVPLFTSATVTKAAHPDLITATSIGAQPDGKIHIQGTIENLPEDTVSITLMSFGENDAMMNWCGQLVNVGDTVVFPDVLDTGNFDLVCADDMTFPLEEKFLIKIKTKDTDGTYTTAYQPLHSDIFTGDSVSLSPAIDYTELNIAPTDSNTWHLSFDNQTSYSYASINLLGVVSGEELHYPVMSTPTNFTSLSAGTNIMMHAQLGTSYENFNMTWPSYVIVFYDSSGDTKGIYQISEPDMDAVKDTLELSTITDDDVITSTSDFNSKVTITDDYLALPSSFLDYFQTWEAWYRLNDKKLNGQEDTWFENVIDNYDNAPVDLTGIKALNREYRTSIKLTQESLLNYCYDNDEVCTGSDITAIMGVGENAFNTAIAAANGSSDILSTIQSSGLYGKLDQYANNVHSTLSSQVSFIDWLVPTAHAGFWGTLTTITLKTLDFWPGSPLFYMQAISTGARTVTGLIKGYSEGGLGGSLKGGWDGFKDGVKTWVDPNTSGFGAIAEAGKIAWDGVFAGIVSKIIDGFNSLLTLLIEFCFLILNWAMRALAWIMGLGESQKITQDVSIVSMWSAIRDFTNVIFILVLLFIAIANIVQFQVDNYAIKTRLPKVIIALIAINFSKLFVQIVLRFTDLFETALYAMGNMGPHGTGISGTTCDKMPNVVKSMATDKLWGVPSEHGWVAQKAEQFHNFAFGGIQQNSLACNYSTILHLDTWRSKGVGESASAEALSNGMFFLILLSVLVLVSIVIVGFFALFIIFLVRVIALWMLTITSPLYFAAMSLPVLESVANKWKEEFWKYAFMHVKLAFYLSVSVLVLQGIEVGGKVASPENPSGGDMMGLVADDILKLLMWVAIVYFAIMKAISDDHIGFMTDKVRNAANWAGKTVAGTIPLGMSFKKGADGKRRPQFITVRNMGGGIKQTYQAFKGSLDARHEEMSHGVAGKITRGLDNTTQRIPVPGMKFARKALHIEQAALRQQAARKSSDRKRAGELAEGMKDDRENELYARLKNSNNVDEVRAVLDTLSQRGLYDERKVLIALQSGQGKISGETKFGIDASRINDLENNPMEALSEKETVALRENISRLTGEKEYPTTLQSQSRSAAQSESNQWMEDAAAHAGNLDEYILNQLLSGDDVDRMQLMGSIRYGYEYGKGNMDGNLITLSKAVQDGQVNIEDMQWIANKSGLSNKYPWLEFISEEEMMNGTTKFKLNDGKEYTYFEAIQKIWEANEGISSDKRVGAMGTDENTQILMQTMLEKGSYVPQRQGKILSSTSNVRNTDHDHGASMQGFASLGNVMAMSHSTSDGTGPRTKQGIVNDFARDLGVIKLAKKQLEQAQKTGTPAEIAQAQERLRASVTRAIGRTDTFFNADVAKKWNNTGNIMNLSKSDLAEKSPNADNKTLGEIVEGHNELLEALFGAGEGDVFKKRIDENGKSLIAGLKADAKEKQYKIDMTNAEIEDAVNKIIGTGSKFDTIADLSTR